MLDVFVFVDVVEPEVPVLVFVELLLVDLPDVLEELPEELDFVDLLLEDLLEELDLLFPKIWAALNGSVAYPS